MAATMLLQDGTRIDRPRNEPRVKIAVKARVDTLLPGGEIAYRGDTTKPPRVNECIVYASDLSRVQEMVEERIDALDQAEALYDKEYEHWLKSKTDDKTWHDDQNGKPNPRFNRDTFGGSIERSFFRIVGVRLSKDGRPFSGIKPLLKVKVLEQLPAPEVPRSMFSDGTFVGGPNSDMLEAYIQQRVSAAVAEALNGAGKKGKSRTKDS